MDFDLRWILNDMNNEDGNYVNDKCLIGFGLVLQVALHFGVHVLHLDKLQRLWIKDLHVSCYFN